ncbi:hypothetical protein D3C71_1287090 [compost metagenome]
MVQRVPAAVVTVRAVDEASNRIEIGEPPLLGGNVRDPISGRLRPRPPLRFLDDEVCDIGPQLKANPLADVAVEALDETPGEAMDGGDRDERIELGAPDYLVPSCLGVGHDGHPAPPQPERRPMDGANVLQGFDKRVGLS